MDDYEEPVLVEDDFKTLDAEEAGRLTVEAVRRAVFKGIAEAIKGDISTMSTEYYCSLRSMSPSSFQNIVGAIRPELESLHYTVVANKTNKTLTIKWTP